MTPLRPSRLGGEARRKLKKQLRKRDGDFCWICGRRMVFGTGPNKGPQDPLFATLEHVVPLADGGRTVIANLKLTHERCNALRGQRHAQERHGA